MDYKDIVKQVSKVQSKAFEDALKAKLNEGFVIEELEVKYETNTVRNANSISTTVKTIIQKKADGN